MGKKKGNKGGQAQGEEEKLAAGVSAVELEDEDGDEAPASAPAPFKFTPAGKGKSPAEANAFSFGGAPAGGAGGAFSFPKQGGQPNFTFNFDANAAPPAGGDDDGDLDEEELDEEEEIDREAMVEEFIKSLPEDVQKCVGALNTLDDEVSELETKFRFEIRELERKYEALKAPVFEKRTMLVIGETKPEGADKTQGVPGFWLGAMKNCGVIASNITEKDEVILNCLTNITADTLPEDEGIGFRLVFHFKENEFFKNSTLKKTYYMADTGEDPVLEKAEGEEIEWESGKNVTVKIKKKTQRNKNGKGTRTVTKTEPCESFFNFFSPPKIPNPEEDEGAEDDELLQMELQSDYEMGIALQERIVPHAIKWFTGEAEDDEDEDEMYEDEEEFDDEELDEDEEEDMGRGRGRGGGGRGGGMPPGMGRGGGGGRGGRGGGRGQQECKQQ